MSEAEKSLVLSLAEGVTDTATTAEETAGGIITTSDNTRLSKPDDTVSKRPVIESLAVLTAGDVCGGFAQTADGSVAAYFRPKLGTKRIYAADTTPSIGDIRSTLVPGEPQNAYFPYPLDLADGLPGLQGAQPSVAVDGDGYIWSLSVRTYDASNSVALFASVADPNGRQIVTSRRVSTLDISGWPTGNLAAIGLMSWCGLTYHDGTGLVAWYHTAGTIRAIKLSLDLPTLTITVGAGALIATPFAVNKSVAQLFHFSIADVSVDPETPSYAYLVCVNSAADTAVDIHKVDVSTLTVTSTLTRTGRLTTGTTNQQHFSVSAWSVGASRYLAVMTSDRNTGGAAVGTYLDLVNASAMTATWTKSPISLTTSGYTAALPYYFDGALYIVAAVSTCNLGSGTAIGTSTPSATTFSVFNLAGALGNTIPVYWHKLAARAVHHKVSDTEIYPFFPLQLEWNMTATSVAPTDVAYVEDPSIEICSFFDVSSRPSAVMRCAVDRAARKDGPQNGNSAIVASNKLLVTYLEDKTDQAYADGIGFRARYARFDLAPTTQPAVVRDGDVAVMAASVPGVWDGNETTEYSPMHKPKVAVVATGGTGATLTGTYAFTAVVSWRDGSGLMRESAAALPVTVSPAGSKPMVYVTIPQTMRNGSRQEEFEIVVYATGNLTGGGTSLFYAQNMEPTSKATNGCWVFGNVPTPVVADIQLRSSGAVGEPLQNEAPPPAYDACGGNARLWLLDAENRNRVLPSMLKQAHVAYQFNGALEINIPTSHGKGVALQNNGGTMVCFAEYGIWALPGYGPDNSGLSGSFGDPQLISNMGCRSRESVVQVPGVGILFQCSDGKFALLNGAGLERFENLGSFYDVGTPGVFLTHNEIVYPIKVGLLWLAFNWKLKQWTKWPYSTTRPISATTTIHTPLTGVSAGVKSRVLQYAPSTGELEYVDSNTAGGGLMTVTRGWIAPEGPHGDCVIREAWLHCRRNGAHGVKVRVAFDYDETKYVERSWTNAELTEILQNGRYTVAVNLHATPARAIKVTVYELADTESPGDVVNFLSLTVWYGVNGKPRRRTLKAAALK
jgi:hypothetical protein